MSFWTVFTRRPCKRSSLGLLRRHGSDRPNPNPNCASPFLYRSCRHLSRRKTESTPRPMRRVLSFRRPIERTPHKVAPRTAVEPSNSRPTLLLHQTLAARPWCRAKKRAFRVIITCREALDRRPIRSRALARGGSRAFRGARLPHPRFFGAAAIPSAQRPGRALGAGWALGRHRQFQRAMGPSASH